MGRLGNILRCVGEFIAVLGASWEYLGSSGRRLGVVLEASWSRLGGVLGRLGPSWGVMCASLARPGDILGLLEVSWDRSGSDRKKNALESIGFGFENDPSNLKKTKKNITKIIIFCFQALLTKHPS